MNSTSSCNKYPIQLARNIPCCKLWSHQSMGGVPMLSSYALLLSLLVAVAALVFVAADPKRAAAVAVAAFVQMDHYD
jgi:hypothetical protein